MGRYNGSHLARISDYYSDCNVNVFDLAEERGKPPKIGSITSNFAHELALPEKDKLFQVFGNLTTTCRLILDFRS